MKDANKRKRKASLEMPICKAAKSAIFSKIDLDSDATPTLKKGTRSVTNQSHGGRQNKQIADRECDCVFYNQVVKPALFGDDPTQGDLNIIRHLCIENHAPPEYIARKLFDMIKDANYKAPLQLFIADKYASALVSMSARLVRHDGSAIFGPSSWEDIELLLSQSTDLIKASSGTRLTRELQIATCGSKLLANLLRTELLDFDMYTTGMDFSSETLKAKPTVEIMKVRGLRHVLKTATLHTTRCLIRHAKWLVDCDVDVPPSKDPTSKDPNYVASCASHANTCLDSLGSVVCHTAWLLCAEEGVSIEHNCPAFIIRDAFLSELSIRDNTLPQMNDDKRKMFITNLKLHFHCCLNEEFAFPLQDNVEKKIGLEDDLDSLGEESSEDENDIATLNCSAANQFERKSSKPVQVMRRNQLVEAYELDNKDSSLCWVEYVSDGKCEPISSDRIIRRRKPKSRSSKKTTFDVDSQLLSRGKSSRSVVGEKIKPLYSNVVQEDLCRMQAYDKECKKFCIETFRCRNNVQNIFASGPQIVQQQPHHSTAASNIEASLLNELAPPKLTPLSPTRTTNTVDPQSNILSKSPRVCREENNYLVTQQSNNNEPTGLILPIPFRVDNCLDQSMQPQVHTRLPQSHEQNILPLIHQIEQRKRQRQIVPQVHTHSTISEEQMLHQRLWNQNQQVPTQPNLLRGFCDQPLHQVQWQQAGEQNPGLPVQLPTKLEDFHHLKPLHHIQEQPQYHNQSHHLNWNWSQNLEQQVQLGVPDQSTRCEALLFPPSYPVHHQQLQSPFLYGLEQQLNQSVQLQRLTQPVRVEEFFPQSFHQEQKHQSYPTWDQNFEMPGLRMHNSTQPTQYALPSLSSCQACHHLKRLDAGCSSYHHAHFLGYHPHHTSQMFPCNNHQSTNHKYLDRPIARNNESSAHTQLDILEGFFRYINSKEVERYHRSPLRTPHQQVLQIPQLALGPEERWLRTLC